MKLNKYYALLAAAIACEAFGTTMLKASNGFTLPLETALFAVGYVACFVFLTFSLKGLQLGVAYGIWAGLGVAIATVIGIVIWGDSINWTMATGITLVIVGVVLLEMSVDNEAPGEEA